MGKKAVIFLIAMLVCSTANLSLKFSVAFCEGRFTNNGNGTVTDHELGLMWATMDNHQDVSWQEADWYCNMGPPHLVGKYKDWRMPTLDELKSLYVMNPTYRGYTAACGQQVRIIPEIRISCGQLWTYERRLTSAWIYNFTDGTQYTQDKSAKAGYRALPVRSLKTGEY